MIEILNKDDVKNVDDLELKEYLKFSLNRLPSDFEYPEFGFFVIIENINELLTPTINVNNNLLNGLNNDLYDEINMVEIKDEIMEILVFLDNDVSVGLILKMNILDDIHKAKLLSYKF